MSHRDLYNHASPATLNLINQTVVQVVAREVEFSMTMARGFGWRLPLSYDVGVVCRQAVVLPNRDIRLTIAVRIQDTRHIEDAIIPSQQRADHDQALDKFWIQVLHVAAITVMRYLGDHPELAGDQPLTVLEAIRKTGDDEFLQRVGAAARKAKFELR